MRRPHGKYSIKNAAKWVIFATLNTNQDPAEVQATQSERKYRIPSERSSSKLCLQFARLEGDGDAVDGDEATPLLLGGIAGDGGAAAVERDEFDVWRKKEWMPYQLFPMTVMGEQLRPTSTRTPLRSRPRMAATKDAAPSWADVTLAQHWGEVGGVTGGGGVPLGMAAARVYRRKQGLENWLNECRIGGPGRTMSTEVTTTESLENIFVCERA
jgi:hypothetical protein